MGLIGADSAIHLALVPEPYLIGVSLIRQNTFRLKSIQILTLVCLLKNMTKVATKKFIGF